MAAARTPSITPSQCLQSNPTSLAPPSFTATQWLGTMPPIKFSLFSSNFRPRPRINATVSFSLPVSNPERFAVADKIPKWSSKAIKSFAMSELEARKIKSPTTGTEALLMGILIEGTSFASKFLHANGITLLKVRDEIIKIRGKPELFYFSPEHPPLTEAAQRALDWAIDEKLKAGIEYFGFLGSNAWRVVIATWPGLLRGDKGEITTSHLLLGVWQQEESPGHQVLASLGFNGEKAKELHSLVSEPGFGDDL